MDFTYIEKFILRPENAHKYAVIKPESETLFIAYLMLLGYNKYPTELNEKHNIYNCDRTTWEVKIRLSDFLLTTEMGRRSIAFSYYAEENGKLTIKGKYTIAFAHWDFLKINNAPDFFISKIKIKASSLDDEEPAVMQPVPTNPKYTQF